MFETELVTLQVGDHALQFRVFPYAGVFQNINGRNTISLLDLGSPLSTLDWPDYTFYWDYSPMVTNGSKDPETGALINSAMFRSYGSSTKGNYTITISEITSTQWGLSGRGTSTGSGSVSLGSWNYPTAVSTCRCILWLIRDQNDNYAIAVRLYSTDIPITAQGGPDDTHIGNSITTNPIVTRGETRVQAWEGLAAFISSKPSIENFTVILNRYNWRYTGEFITPTLTVTNPETQEVLVENTDYTKTYENNLNPGQADVLAAGMGDYTGSKTVYFTIYEPDISTNASITLDKYYWPYTGQEIEPAVTVFDAVDEVKLTEGVDYEVVYEDNIDIGTATVTVVGIGDWTGEKSVNFFIAEGHEKALPVQWRRYGDSKLLSTSFNIIVTDE